MWFYGLENWLKGYKRYKQKVIKQYKNNLK